MREEQFAATRMVDTAGNSPIDQEPLLAWRWNGRPSDRNTAEYTTLRQI